MIHIKASHDSPRLDVFITENSDLLNRSIAGKLCSQNKVKVNGEIRPSKHRVRVGDEIAIDYQTGGSKISRQSKQIKIIFENDDVIVIDKPVGVLSHSKGGFNSEFTVEDFIKPKLSDIEGPRAGIVHRLDRATSGVMICAKNEKSHKWLQKQFAERKTEKSYTAIVTGKPEPSEAVIDIAITRDPKSPKKFIASSIGKSAQTYYKVLKSNAKRSLLKLQPKTGRTHQLRVHMSYINHPIIGDDLYGKEHSSRMLLHASELKITLPNFEKRTFTAKPPKEFEL